MAYDVVVVGAGPAGSATAAHLSRHGARVLLCDRAAHAPNSPWRDKACGGGLTPRGVAALDRLKVDLAATEAISVGGLEMIGHRAPLAVGFPVTSVWPDHGLVARRSVLDARILEVAIASGAELRHARVVGPLFVDGVCRGVRVRSGDATENIEAAWTVAADGATSVVARAAGLAHEASSGRGFWYAAVRGYAGPVEPHVLDGRPLLEFYPLRTPSGRWLPAYGWVFPLPDGSANIGVDLPHAPSLPAVGALRAAYESFVERLRRHRPGFEGAELLGPPSGALLPEAMHGFRPGAPGLLAVGDAAGMITPYSGEGIAYALEGAELAAEALIAGQAPTETLRRYAGAVRDGYGFHFAAALRIMKAMRHPLLAGAAAAVGLRSRRALRAAVRVMAYLIEDAEADSTVSRGFRRAERVWRRFPG